MIWQAIIAIVTVIGGPVIVFLITRYWNNKVAEAETEKRQASEEEEARAAAAKMADRGKDVNTSIDAQKKAREDWMKTQS